MSLFAVGCVIRLSLCFPTRESPPVSRSAFQEFHMQYGDEEALFDTLRFTSCTSARQTWLLAIARSDLVWFGRQQEYLFLYITIPFSHTDFVGTPRDTLLPAISIPAHVAP